MDTTTLKVDGMHCQGCIQTVQQVIEQLPGVRGCSISLESKQARVAYDPALVSADAIAETVRDAGYAVTPGNT